MKQLYELLDDYSKTDYYPFHMPGHKRNMEINCESNFYKLDITEIEGFDNLHHAEDILLDAQKRASELYQADETFFLVNGSTSGILSAISAVTNIGDKILLARNCHKAAYNALFLRSIRASYLYPEIIEEFSTYGGIDPVKVEQALQEDDEIKAVMITSPTVDGIVSDVDKIAKICHKYGKPLIVDEAHGAHFGFHPNFPENANVHGADIVIHSVHKTLPSLTQTALLHVNGSRIDRAKLKQYMAIYQTSSPSYLLMGSIDYCMEFMEKEGNGFLSALEENTKYFYELTKSLTNIRILKEDEIGKNAVFDVDKGKIVISVKNTCMTGQQIYDMLLQRFHLQLEMASEDYALAIVTGKDTKEGMKRLADALVSIDKEIQKIETDKQMAAQNQKTANMPNRLQEVYSIYETSLQESEQVKIENSIDKISAEFVYLYPPGIPLIVPGERITETLLNQILLYKSQGLKVQGLQDMDVKNILVVKE